VSIRGFIAFFVVATLPFLRPAIAAPATQLSTEVRGVWLVSQDLLKPRDQIAQMLDQFADAHFNSVFIDIWFRGYVAYPDSKIVPQYPQLHDDVIGFIVDECHKRNLQAHAWLSYGFYAYFTPDATKDKSRGPLLDRYPELTAIDENGRAYLHNEKLGDHFSLCPSNPRSHELLSQILVEAIIRYPFDGAHLDRIRYPSADYCFCDYCKTHREGDFLSWKRQQNLKAVEGLEKAVHAARPRLPITSYVLGPEEMDSKAQAWDLWMEHKLLNAVAVSMYGKEIEPTARKAIEILHNNPSQLICAIAADSDKSTQIYLRNVNVARSLTTLGQITWYSDEVLDDLPELKAGPYATPATMPFTQ
jgi:uncharacterized lipoprotein YddW (UPF0748 family)